MSVKHPPRLWFKAKIYGYGWYPATWQGWGVILLYVLLVFLSAWNILNGTDVGASAVKQFILQTIFLTFFLVYISYTKGEKPRWRWGESDTDHEHPSI